jgi:Ca2+-binding EF-hand superfamily protein
MSISTIRKAACVAMAALLAAGGAMAQMAPKKEAPPVEAAFSRADTNKDGKLSKEEAERMPAIAAKFAELDKNADGFLSVDEFSAGYTDTK